MRHVLFTFVALWLAISNASDEGPELMTVAKGEATEVLPGVTILLDTNYEGVVYEVAEHVEHSPALPEAYIPTGHTFTALNLAISSKLVPTEVRVEATHPDLVSTDARWIQLLPGYNVNLGFTAYEAHAGELLIFNRDDRLIKTIPYVVRRQNPYSQRVSVSGTLERSFSTSYSINQRGGGFSGSLHFGFDGIDAELTGGASISYSW